jgi:hypothetical protein
MLKNGLQSIHEQRLVLPRAKPQQCCEARWLVAE